MCVVAWGGIILSAAAQDRRKWGQHWSDGVLPSHGLASRRQDVSSSIENGAPLSKLMSPANGRESCLIVAT